MNQQTNVQPIPWNQQPNLRLADATLDWNCLQVTTTIREITAKLYNTVRVWCVIVGDIHTTDVKTSVWSHTRGSNNTDIETVFLVKQSPLHPGLDNPKWTIPVYTCTPTPCLGRLEDHVRTQVALETGILAHEIVSLKLIRMATSQPDDDGEVAQGAIMNVVVLVSLDWRFNDLVQKNSADVLLCRTRGYEQMQDESSYPPALKKWVEYALAKLG